MNGLESFSVLAAAVSALASVSCALYIRFSGPIIAAGLMRELATDNESMRLEWARTKNDMEGIAESIAEDVDKAERLRKRIAAARSRENQNGQPQGQVVGPDGQPMSGDDAAAYMRAKQQGLV